MWYWESNLYIKKYFPIRISWIYRHHGLLYYHVYSWHHINQLKLVGPWDEWRAVAHFVIINVFVQLTISQIYECRRGRWLSLHSFSIRHQQWYILAGYIVFALKYVTSLITCFISIKFKYFNLILKVEHTTSPYDHDLRSACFFLVFRWMKYPLQLSLNRPSLASFGGHN